MSKKVTNDIVLRDKRQMTLSRDICKQLGIKPGDKLILYVKDGILVGKPNKTIALEALKELRRSFKSSGITEKELIDTGKSIRRELIKEYYGVDY